MADSSISSKRVYFVASEFGEVHHGPAIYTQNLWNLFSESNDIEFHLIVMHSANSHSRIHALDANGLQRRGFYERLEQHIRATVQKIGPGLLHVNSAHLISPSLAKEFRPVVQINDTEVSQHRFSLANVRRYGVRRTMALAWRRSRERLVAKYSQQVICNSDFTAEMTRKQYGLDDRNVKRIYKAVQLQPFLDAQPTVTTVGPLRILFVGNNWVRKGLDVLIEAIRIVQDSNPPRELSVDVYGEPDDATKARFRNLAKSNGVESIVNFCGLLTRENAPIEFASSHMLALPSFEEALGLVAIEAIAAGIPVVGSRVGGIPEIINQIEFGQLVDPGNALQLAEAIKSQMAAPSDSEIVELRKASSQRFSVERLGVEINGLYSQLIPDE